MKPDRQNPEAAAKSGRGNRLRLGLMAVFLCVFCFSAYKLTDTLLASKGEQDEFASLSALVARERASASPTGTSVQVPVAAGEAIAEERPPEYGGDASLSGTKERSVLPCYAPLCDMNPDFFGWLSIEGTKIDYPVMYSPDRPEHYLHRAFDGSRSYSGVPFMDGACPPDGNMYLIYGHHMRDKTMFGQLPLYAQQRFYEEHSIIRFDTRYEQRAYQVIAAFYSRVYAENEPAAFRYYEFVDLSDEKVFAAYVASVRDAAIYDTGFTAAYGDEFLALSTCNYHTKDGRFVVVAKRIA